MDCSPLGSSVHDLSWQEHCSELPFPIPGDLYNPVIKPMSPVSPALAGGFFTTEPLIYGQIIIKYFTEFPQLTTYVIFIMLFPSLKEIYTNHYVMRQRLPTLPQLYDQIVKLFVCQLLSHIRK